MMNHLKNLCMINGASGDEGSVRNYLISNLDSKAEYHTDNLGNLSQSPPIQHSVQPP